MSPGCNETVKRPTDLIGLTVLLIPALPPLLQSTWIVLQGRGAR